MGSEPKPLSITSAKQGSFYWRQIAQHCHEPQKLTDAVAMLFEELQIHMDAAEAANFELPSANWPTLGALAISEEVTDLQKLISQQVAILEQWRNVEFREKRRIIPPRVWEAQHVAKSILGYDPDIAANARDDEL